MTDTPPPATPAAPVPPPAAAGPKQTLSLTSFIAGLAAIVLTWIPFVNIIGLIAGVVAIITGFLAKKKEPAAPKWMWIVGIIAGFVAVLISLIAIIISIIAIATFGSLGGTLTGY
jgi:phage-related protein